MPVNFDICRTHERAHKELDLPKCSTPLSYLSPLVLHLIVSQPRLTQRYQRNIFIAHLSFCDPFLF